MEDIKNRLGNFDETLIGWMKRWSMPMARIAIFVVYFWFGILKVSALSPANPLVASLLERTLPFISFDTFIILLGLYEMAIGVVFLIKGWERLAFLLLVLHLITVIMPLILLPAITWQSAFVPTLEGQYIIKNILIIACAMSIVSNLQPWKKKSV